MADTTPPTIAITSNKTTLKAGDLAIITFTLSEPATDFVLADVTVFGGTLSNFIGSGVNYQATFTPNENTEFTGFVGVENSKFSDAAGNANKVGSDTNNFVSFIIDTKAPTITIKSSKSIFGVAETALISFTLSEPSTNFTLADVALSGGSLNNFGGSGANYTATFTPKAGVSTNGSITVGVNTFSDATGNLNNQAVTYGLYVDTNTDPRLPKLAWARLLGNQSITALALTTGLDGSTYISGNTLAYDPNGNLVKNPFVIKYNPDGTKVWTRLLSSDQNNISTSITTGKDGSIYVSVNAEPSFTSGIDWLGNPTKELSGISGVFINKLNTDGSVVWTRFLGRETVSSEITTGIDGSIFVSGYTYEPLDGQELIVRRDAFVTKYAPDGSKVWTRLLGTTSYKYGNALAVGADGSVFICGSTDYPDNIRFYVTKCNPDGTKAWTIILGLNNYNRDYAITA